MAVDSLNGSEQQPEFNLDNLDRPQFDNAIVPAGGKLPESIQVPTPKLLDVITGLSASFQKLTLAKKREYRKKLNAKLYAWCRPGFYAEISDYLHIGYLGQPNGHGTQHHWWVFFTPDWKERIESLLTGTAIVISDTPASQSAASGNYSHEWGGLYLRSAAEVKIAEALDRTGVLFFANVRGRVGRMDAVSNEQLTGRVEVDFLIVLRGKSIILEVDGKHHDGEGQTIRDYARDRVLLKAGIPTVRFLGQDCFRNPDRVVAETLAIFQELASA